MTKVHLLAGPNNSGKSTALEVVRRLIPALRDGKAPDLTDLDTPISIDGEQPSDLRLAVRAHVSPDQLEALDPERPELGRAVANLLQATGFSDDGPGVWFEFGLQHNSHGTPNGWAATPEQVAVIQQAAQSPDRLESMAKQFTRQYSGRSDVNAALVLGHLHTALAVQAGLPPVAAVPAFRRIGPSGGEGVLDDEHGGPGLIERLARLQNPGFEAPQDRKRFDEVREFVADLFDDPHTVIEVPHDRATILVHHKGRRLPLEHYGTGLHQVVILAVAATVLRGYLVCIEEPEIHLHPGLQRKLLQYLQNHTENQYLIATHSAHLLDSQRASISAVRQRKGYSEVSRAVAPADVATLSGDLGARASDLVQANAIIWVEGPSDRVYVRHWLHLVADELVEGVHYTIMFYGGSLLRHLEPTDTLVEEFISLPRINRNFSLVMDSDRRTARARLNQTKTRVRIAIEAGPAVGGAWVTKGFTVENYVPAELLAAAVTAVHPTIACRWKGDLYVNPLGPKQLSRGSSVDKVAVAREVVGRWTDEALMSTALRRQVRRVVKMVRAANGLPVPA